MRRDPFCGKIWERLQVFLPPTKPGSGRPRKPHKPILRGIWWRIRTGAPWRDIPEKFGNWSTIYDRFRKWVRTGLWDEIFRRVQSWLDREDQLDWELHFVDGTTIPAHPHAAGAPGGQTGHALGQSRGGFTTKLHLRIDQDGNVIHMLTTAGQRHESPFFEELMNAPPVHRPRGRPKRRPEVVAGDKGYSSKDIRDWCRSKGIRPVIPRPSDARKPGPFDRQTYRRRNRIERRIGHLKQYRALATRYEKRVDHYEALWKIVAAVENVTAIVDE
jgi:transposase